MNVYIGMKCKMSVIYREFIMNEKEIFEKAEQVLKFLEDCNNRTELDLEEAKKAGPLDKETEQYIRIHNFVESRM